MKALVLPRPSDLYLYIASVLIWGSTWFAIKLQLGVVPPAVSVLWRFLIAALVLLAFARLRGLPPRFSLRNHLWMALQGVLLFCVNYIAVYLAEQYLASGLVAVMFSMLAVGNIAGMKLFFRFPVSAVNVAGAVLGIAGVALLFWLELRQFSPVRCGSVGVALALGGTTSASLGNMVATRNQRCGLPALQVNGWSMLYGALTIGCYAALMGQEFTFDASWPYVASLIYLSLFGSVLAFGAYLTLMSRIGADRAGYSMVAIPVVGLLVSTILENLRWTIGMWVGVGLCLVGNVPVLRHRSA
jgi:drug/metabolite transporter (DMT)-like permease